MVATWPRRYSARCFQPCCLAPLETVSLALVLGTGPTESCLIRGGCRLSRRWGRLFSETFRLFADDCEINTGNEQEMQEGMDSFSSVCNIFVLTISTKKTEPAPGNQCHELQISINEPLRTWVAHSPAMPTSMPRSTTESPRLAAPLVD